MWTSHLDDHANAAASHKGGGNATARRISAARYKQSQPFPPQMGKLFDHFGPLAHQFMVPGQESYPRDERHPKMMREDRRLLAGLRFYHVGTNSLVEPKDAAALQVDWSSR